MTIKSTGEIHINHQFCLSPQDDYRSKRNDRFKMSQHEIDSFNLKTKDYLNSTNTKQSKVDVIRWIKRDRPVAAITVVFNCAIDYNQSIDLLNRFYDQLCKYQFGRTYKKRKALISMFAFLENAVIDKNKQSYLRHEDCNHFHLVLCDPEGNFESFNTIKVDIENARRQANSNFIKALKAELPDASFIPQIARCKVQDYYKEPNFHHLQNYQNH